MSPRFGVVGNALYRAPLYGVLAAPLEDTSRRGIRCGLPSCEIMDGACRLTGLLNRVNNERASNLKRIGNGIRIVQQCDEMTGTE